MRSIERLWAFVVHDGLGEGLVAFQNGGEWFPMVAADADRVEDLKAIAKKIVKRTGQKITLVEFSKRTEIEVIS